MAPISNLIFGRRTYHQYQNNDGGGSNGGGIGGGVVAAIIALVVLVFVCVYISEYNKAKRIRAQTGAPISQSKCIKKALLIAVTLGLASCLCAECCALNDSGNGPPSDPGTGGGRGVLQMDQAGDFVQQPMPSYQPQMDYTPIDNAATAPVQ